MLRCGVEFATQDVVAWPCRRRRRVRGRPDTTRTARPRSNDPSMTGGVFHKNSGLLAVGGTPQRCVVGPGSQPGKMGCAAAADVPRRYTLGIACALRPRPPRWIHFEDELKNHLRWHAAQDERGISRTAPATPAASSEARLETALHRPDLFDQCAASPRAKCTMSAGRTSCPDKDCAVRQTTKVPLRRPSAR